jgi:hypothetical protein
MSTTLPDKINPNWYVVATVGSVTEATIIIGRLEHLGVPAVMRGSTLSGALGLTIGTTVKVLVPEKFYDFAYAAVNLDPDVALLEDGESSDEDSDDEADLDSLPD